MARYVNLWSPHRLSPFWFGLSVSVPPAGPASATASSSCAFLSCQRSLSLPRPAWSSTLMPPPRRKNVDTAERCGELEVPLFPAATECSVVGVEALVEVEEEQEVVRHEKISAEDRCTRQGRRLMFARANPTISLADTDPLFLRKATLAPSLGHLLAH